MGACVCGVVVVLCGFKSNVAVKYSRVFFGGRPVGPRSYLDSDTVGVMNCLTWVSMAIFGREKVK